MLIKSVPTLFTPAKALEVQAANANTEEDGWTYQIRPAGLYRTVAVYDETGEFLGEL